MMLVALICCAGVLVGVPVVAFVYETLELRREAERLRRVVQVYEQIDRIERRALVRMRRQAGR
jgi:hypothetical protein